LGVRWAFLLALFVALVTSGWAARHALSAAAAVGSLLVIALVADQHVRPLGHETMTALDEGMVMDMPITWPRASVTQSADDLKARDMMLCRFPEVDMVVGKAGRAETPTDPAPLDMIETMVNFRPPDLWPKRKLRAADAKRQARAVLDAVAARGLIEAPANEAAKAALVNDAMMTALPRFDAVMRECVYQRNQEFERDLRHRLVRFGQERVAAMLHDNGTLPRPLSGVELARLSEPEPREYSAYLAKDLTPADVTRLARDTVRQLGQLGFIRPGGDPLRYQPSLPRRVVEGVHGLLGGQRPTFVTRLRDALAAEHRSHWAGHVRRLDGELLERAPATWTRLVLEETLSRTTVTDPTVAATLREMKRLRSEPPPSAAAAGSGHNHHHGGAPAAPLPSIDPNPALDRLQGELTRRFAAGLLLWPAGRSELSAPGGELDRTMQMPGWANVWTMPIQNRVDMLSTGVNTAVGVRVLGRRLEDVLRASQDIAAVLETVPGRATVVVDPVRGKGYLEVYPDREKAARLGVSVGDINDVVEIALGGKVASLAVEGRERHPVRVRYPRAWREDEESVRNLLVPVRDGAAGGLRHVPLSQVADVRVADGPAAIKSENGLLRNYVKLNVQGRGAAEFVEEARRAVAGRVRLPPGVYVEWTGQFEHEERAWRTLLVIVPLVIGLIFLVLYLTYHDLADAILMVLAVPGAMAGGVFFQYLFGYNFSVTVWMGYIACFGMATSTGIIMLVYLREAVEKAGGLAALTPDRLRQAVMDGAVHRLRPKLLTEGITVIGLAPLLWANGVGAEVIKPMVLPVLGGLLVADEVIDLLLPVLFYRVRRWRWERLDRRGP
jgi:Cu(I)/Ag(I) efflux system membrane protein CusA/SilA